MKKFLAVLIIISSTFAYGNDDIDVEKIGSNLKKNLLNLHKADTNSGSMPPEVYCQDMLNADINADGKRDAIIVCGINTSGVGGDTEQEFDVYLAGINGPIHSGSTNIFSERLSGINFKNGIIYMEYDVRMPGDSMAESTGKRVDEYKIVNGKFKKN